MQTEYQPSSELMDAIDSLIQEQNEEKKAAVFEGSSLTGTLRLGPCT
jgi:excinuclease UvrABC helicase subunit UvrB